MNKRMLYAGLFALCGSAAFALPAFAQDTTPQATPAASQSQSPGTASNGQSAMPSQRDAKRAVPPLDSRMCIRDTGSHIPPPKGQCLPVAGSSYSQRDILQTGATNVGQALQMLDPSVTVHGH